MLRRVLILAAMTLSALASELGGSGHRCIWSGMPRRERVEKRQTGIGTDSVTRRRSPM
ncbi:conserved exported hypothetical protein [Cupriavidus oxalaticus]|uniref:MarR family transcriptional regulator n=1 Tax=Cupriavidus oxalaticus TaxID=96344 RepID=A0A375FZK0_9BURK|nr:conserved exported hypothetical protein [Cupriavidus oxalaticus]SPC12524.1 conserved exported hypothetical protein [Cupriavidus oxalaticus]